MILRRVIEHFRKQEWTAIFLDFVIVVVGVFVGLQVNTWNAARQLKAEQHSTLVRLLSEAEEGVYYWRWQIFYVESALANQRRLLAALSAGVTAPQDRAAVEDGLMRIAHYPSISPPHAVYDELIASGGLRLISDLETRQAVSAYRGKTDFIEGQLVQFRTASLPKAEYAFRGRVFSAYAPDRESLRRFDYDFPALASDPQFVSDIIDLVRNQLQFQVYREAALKAAEEMCAAAARAVDDECEVAPLDLEEIDAYQGVNK